MISKSSSVRGGAGRGWSRRCRRCGRCASTPCSSTSARKAATAGDGRLKRARAARRVDEGRRRRHSAGEGQRRRDGRRRRQKEGAARLCACVVLVRARARCKAHARHWLSPSPRKTKRIQQVKGRQQRRASTKRPNQEAKVRSRGDRPPCPEKIQRARPTLHVGASYKDPPILSSHCTTPQREPISVFSALPRTVACGQLDSAANIGAI